MRSAAVDDEQTAGDDGEPLQFGLENAPALGPYCPITGRRRWPWYTHALATLFQALSLVAIFVGANHVHTELYGAGVAGRSKAVFLWTALALVLHVAGWFFARLGFAMRTLLALGAVAALVVAWGHETPLSFADPNVAWTVALDDVRVRFDTFLAEAALPSALVWFAALYALLAVFVTANTLHSVLRSWHLPRHLWFARFHPVWRRRYEPHESVFPIAGVLAVRDDEWLADKLVLIGSRERDAAFVFAPTAASGAHALPLSTLLAPFGVWRAEGHWWASRALPSIETGAPFALRFLFEPRDLPVGADESALAAPSDPSALPVLDVYASDAALFGKRRTVDGERDELFGVLFDARPEVGTDGRPQATVFLRRGGRVRAEHASADLLGSPHHDAGRLLVPWRGAGDEPHVLELDGAKDSVHFVPSANGGHHLYFLAFAPRAGAPA
jgi:hypothetical protein